MIARLTRSLARWARSPLTPLAAFALLGLVIFATGTSRHAPPSHPLSLSVGPGFNAPGSAYLEWSAPGSAFVACSAEDGNPIAYADGPYPSTGLYWYDSSDPTTGGGMPAPFKQLLVRTDSPSIYFKSGDAATAWTKIGNGSGGGGGGGSGTVTSIACGAGLSCAPDSPITTAGTITVHLPTTTCGAGSAEIATAADGTSTCGAFLAPSAISGTLNVLPKFTSTTTIGNSLVTDDATTFAISTNKFTVVEASGNTAVAGTLTADAGLRVFDATGTGLASTANAVRLNITPTTCGAGSAEITTAADGTSTCGAFLAPSAISGTLNVLPRFTSTTTIGNSLVADDGATFAINGSEFTVVESNGNTTVAGTLTADAGSRVFDATGTGIASTANVVRLNITPTTCGAGSAEITTAADGTSTCGAFLAPSAISGTLNVLPKFTSTTTIGNSLVTDDGTTFAINANRFTVTEFSGNTAAAGTLTADAGLRVFDATGTGLASTANAVRLNITPTTCGAGSAEITTAADGTSTCGAFLAPSAISGTLNVLPKFTSTTTIGNSLVTDDATTFAISTNKFTVTEASGNTAVAGTLTADAGARVFDSTGTGLTSTANAVRLNITPTTCGAGSAEITTAADGTSTCGAFLAPSAISGTLNVLPKFTSTTTIGNSLVTDDGTTFAINATEFTVTEANGNTAVAGTLTADAGSRVFDATGTGLASTANAVRLNITPTTCGAGSAEITTAADGTSTCGAFLAPSAISGTLNVLPKFTSTTTLGNSLVTDDGTTFSINGSEFTVTEANGNTAVAGTLTADAGLRVFDAVGTGLASTTNAVRLNIAPTTCSAGSAEITTAADGTSTCSAFLTPSAIFGTANQIPKYVTTSTLGGSSVSDNGTTFSVNAKFTVTEASGNTAALGTFAAGTSGQMAVAATGKETIGFVQAAATVSSGSLVLNNTGTYNATAGALTSIGAAVSTTTTRSAGANNLTNIAADFTASGAQVNWAARFNNTINITTGHIETTGSSPSASACGSTPSPSVNGTDIAGIVTVGGAAVTSCTLTFGATYGAAPACTLTSTTGLALSFSTTATTLVVTNAGLASSVFHYICMGLSGQ